MAAKNPNNANEKYMKTSQKKNHNRLVEVFGAKTIGPKIAMKQSQKTKFQKQKNNNKDGDDKKPNAMPRKTDKSSKPNAKSNTKSKITTKKAYKLKKQTLNKEHNEIMQMKDNNDEKTKKTQVCFDSIKDNLQQYIKSPDSSRVIQYFICQGDESIKTKIFDSLKDEILNMLLDKHGAFVVEKMFKNMDSEKQDYIFSVILSHISSLATKKTASKVIDSCYKNFFTVKQKTELLYRFMGPQFLLDIKSDKTLQEILSDKEKKETLLEHLKKHSYRLLRHKTISRSFVHNIIHDYVKLADDSEVSAICKELIPHVKVLCPTQHGAQISILVLKHADASEQKTIVRELEESLLELCTSSHAYIFVCAIIRLVKLEGLLVNKIGKVMNHNMETFFTNKFASRVLIWLVSAKDDVKDCPSDMQDKLAMVNELEENPAQEQLMKCVMKKITVQFVSSEEMIADNLFLQSILLKVIGKSEKYSQTIAESAFKSLSAQFNQVSYYDSAKHHFFLKKLIKSDAKNDFCKFSDLFIDNLSNIKLSNVYATNRGCFIIILLLENASSESAALLKEILKDHKPNLEQIESKNAKVLLESI